MRITRQSMTMIKIQIQYVLGNKNTTHAPSNASPATMLIVCRYAPLERREK